MHNVNGYILFWIDIKIPLKIEFFQIRYRTYKLTITIKDVARISQSFGCHPLSALQLPCNSQRTNPQKNPSNRPGITIHHNRIRKISKMKKIT